MSISTPGRRVLTGLDAVDIARFRLALQRYPRLRERLFSHDELAYAAAHGDPVVHLAARFAAKEAVGKLLGTGVTSWQEIRVENSGGAPSVRLLGRAAERAGGLGLGPIALSLTHTDTMALANTVAVVAGCDE